MIGTSLGPYKIIEQLGAGGMGEVYRARDTKLERDVAIKVLPDDLAADPDRLSRFEREAKLLAALNHSNIGAIHGLEDTDGIHFLVLELIEGESLEQRLRKGAIPVPQALDIARQIAEALEAAHDAGIIHRDVKPANVLLTPKGGVKVLDFGIAKSTALDGATNAALTEQATSLTVDGTLMGTPPYMAPEQIRGEEIDKRTDIWAFGCVVYEMLTGTAPFARETVADTLVAVLEVEPDWKELPGSTPAQVELMLQRCLRKDPHRRLRDIADGRIEIEEGRDLPPAGGKMVGATHQAPRFSVRGVVAILSMIAVALSAVIWDVIGTARSSPPVVRTTVDLEPGTTLHQGLASSVAISPSGDRVVYAASSGAGRRLYSRRLSDLEAVPLLDTEGAHSPFFSPDGTWLGFAQNGLRKVPLSGGGSSLIEGLEGVGAPGSIRGASWGSDDRIVLTPGSITGLWEIDVGAATNSNLTEPNAADREKTHRLPEVLPGGQTVLFALPTVDNLTWDEASIAVYSRVTDTIKVLPVNGTSPRFSESGHLLYVRNASILAVPFDADTLEISGTPVTIADDVSTSALWGSADYAVSNEAGGTLVYATGGTWGDQRTVVKLNTDGSRTPLVVEPRAFVEARMSHAGDKLAVQIDGPNSSIWLYPVGRNSPTRFASGFDHDSIIWSPDDSQLAFRSNRAGNFDIYLQPTDGGAPAKRLLGGDARFDPWSWSDDGTLTYTHDGDVWIWSSEMTAGRRLFQTDHVERTPSLSPNGRWIAYSSNATDTREVYVRSFPESDEEIRISTSGGTEPCWGPDSSRLFYRAGDAEETKIMAVDIEPRVGDPQLVVEQPFPPSARFDCANDGSLIVIEEASATAPASQRLVLVQNLFSLIEQRMAQR